MEKVGILGSAVVGQTLAQGFKAHGYREFSQARWKRSRVGATSWSWRCRGLVRKRP